MIPIDTARRSAPTIVLTALTLATAASLCRVFSGWDYMPKMLVIVLVAHGVAAAMRLGRWPGAIAIPVGLGTVVVLVSLAYYPGTQWALLPTRSTIALARSDLAEAWTQVGIVVPPVSPTAGFGLAAALALGIAAVTADAFAFRAHGRIESLVPSGVVFVAVSAVGIDRNRIRVTVLWLLCALVFVAVSRAADALSVPGWVGRRTGGAWVRWVAGGAVVALAASVGAGMIGPRLPGAGADALLDPDVHDGDGVTEIVSPLVDIRGRLVDRSNTVLFSVIADRPQYWRLSGLPVFDGRVWGLPDRELDEATGDLSDEQPFAAPIVQRFEIEALGGNLAPVALTPTELRSTTIDLFFVQDTSTLVVPGDGLSHGTRYEIVSSASDPSIQVLTAATADSPPDAVYTELPDDWDSDLTQTAEEIVAGQPTPYNRARALQDWFRTNFTYSLDVPSGHSVNAIDDFLDRRSGYCEQFAGTFAAFARAVGLPARVAVGFTTGDRGADGRYRVRGRQAHAWPEVWFDGVGWVIFEPTPGRGAPGAENHTGVPAQQDESRADPSTDPASPGATIEGGTTASTTPGGSTLPSTPVTTVPPVAAEQPSGGSAIPGILGGVLAAILLWMLAMPWIVRLVASRRRADDGDRIVATWNATVRTAALAGVSTRPSDTPVEAARRVSVQSGIDRHELAELASATTRVLYSPHTIDAETVVRCETIGRHVLHTARSMVPWQQRLLARVDPRLARRLAG